MDISSPPHHRLNIEASTEGSRPGVDVALALTTARCVRTLHCTAVLVLVSMRASTEKSSTYCTPRQYLLDKIIARRELVP